MNDDYPVQFSVDYGDGSRNRLTTLFRIIMIIPISCGADGCYIQRTQTK